MPWSPSDAHKKNKNVDTPAEKKQWARIANRVLKETEDDAQAIRTANAAAKRKRTK